PETDPTSEEYADAAQGMLYDYYIQNVAATIHADPADVARMRIAYGPALFTVSERLGDSATVARHGVVAGALMGNGHLLTSGGSMTGMIGHFQRFVKFWHALNEGADLDAARTDLEAGIRGDSQAWLHVSAKEFFDVSPINFGAERARAVSTESPADPPTHA